MPRNYGITNIAPWSSAPAVGLAGDIYWNTLSSTLFVSNGSSWLSASGVTFPLTNNAGTSGVNQYQTRIAADSQYRFTITTDGALSWGSGSAGVDTLLQRSGVGVLTLNNGLQITTNAPATVPLILQEAASQTADSFRILTSTAAVLTAINSTGGLYTSQSAAGNGIFTSYVAGGANPMYALNANGAMGWGPGGATAQDTSLLRGAPGQLNLTASAGNNAILVLNTAGTAGSQLYFTMNGAFTWLFYQNTGDNNIYFRDLVNARMQMIFRPAASVTAANTEINSSLTVDGPTTMSPGASGSTALRVNSAASQSVDLVQVYDSASHYLFRIASTGETILYHGQLDLLPTTSNGPGRIAFWEPTNSTYKWFLQTNTSDTHFYIIDAVNSRNQITLTPGADASTAVTSINSQLQSLGMVSLPGVVGIANSQSIVVGNPGTSGVVSQLQLVANGASSLLLFGTAGSTLWQFYQNSGDPHFYFRDMVNARMQMTFTPGASATAAITDINSALTVDGNASIGGAGSFGGGTGPMMFLANDTADPTTNPTGGIILYSSAGVLNARTPSGSITQIAPSPGLSGAAGGDLSGTYPNPTVFRINGTSLAGLTTGLLKNTTATGVPSIAVAADIPTVAAGVTGPLSATDLTTTNSRAPSGTATGDLSGTYPAPLVAKINGTSVPALPASGQVLAATSTTSAAWQTLLSLRNLPAPVTSGTTVQSFTDVYGVVWVAKNGVNGGNWFRARDVLHGRIVRTAAWNTSATLVQFSYDAVRTDPYGMFVSAQGGFVAPIAGYYLWTANLSAAVASGGFLQLEMQNTTAAVAYTDVVGPGATAGPGSLTSAIMGTASFPAAAGDVLKVFQRAATVVAGGTGGFCSSNLDYLGTG